ncbi:DUF4198 domain-containing protein [Sphingopyxis sp. R3-92]|uniref:DUF4198 domain-containing protein n=1 Tax=Sphingopyxis sp. R3-92 TaxID=3158553 RepID=UPI003EE7CDEC
MKRKILGFAATVALAAVAIVPASAHRQWMLPSSTVLSGDDVWVTVDAAVSNDLFYFEHQPLRLDAVKAWAPDGTEAAIENKATGRYRSTFDVHLTQKGTWRIASVSDGLMGSYDLGGKTERLPRGTTTANLAERLPAGATNVKTAESSNRNEIFVTVGEPTTTLFKPTGKGIELAPVTHPNDLIAGEAASFQFLLDGKPAAGLTVTVIPGGIRYRNDLGEMNLKTDAQGKVDVNWAEPGMYWLNVTTPQAERAEGAGEPPLQRRASYVTTLEVLAP